MPGALLTEDRGLKKAISSDGEDPDSSGILTYKIVSQEYLRD
jgi:hypothetical protein